MTRSSTAPPSHWAVWCAWLIPLTILPSAIWRVALLFRDGRPVESLADGGWYLVLLSGVSIGLGLLTVGLVRPWGEVLPRWIPVLGGRIVPARAAAGVAWAGGGLLIAVMVYGAAAVPVARLSGRPVTPDPVVDPLPPQPEPGWEVLFLYLPMLGWGPLLIAVACDYYRRRRAAPAE